MGRKHAKAPITEDMLPDEGEVDAYDPFAGTCCVVQQFRPDLNASPTSVWNQSIIEVFVDHFMELHPASPSDRVEELFTGHLKYLCNKWLSTTLSEKTRRDRRKLLNRSERQRNVSASDQYLDALSRFAQLYYRRLAVAHAYAPLRRHIPVLMALGVAGMSSDESDHSNGVAQYGVFIKEWRAKRITTWLRVFDSLYRRLRMNDAKQSSPGSHPHSRFYSNKVSARRPPVKGLPRNAYDPKWLKGLHQYDRKHLLIQEVDYNFAHDQDMLECVFRSHAVSVFSCSSPMLPRLAADYNGKHNPLGIYF